MAVLAADSTIALMGGGVKIVGPANGADIFYSGAILWGLAAGYVSCAPSAGDRPLGICTKRQTTLAQGDFVEYVVGGTYLWVTLATLTAADIGDNLVFDSSVAVSDNPADALTSGDVTAAVNDVFLGRIVGFDAAGKGIVCLDGMGLIMNTAGAVAYV